MATTVQANAAKLGSIGFQVETNDFGFLIVQSTSHKLTPAGVIAVLGVVNTYLSGLSAGNFAALVAGNAGTSVHVAPFLVRYPVQPADISAQVTAITNALTTAANTTRG